jgi:Acetoacetate decarboxylase (ADC)
MPDWSEDPFFQYPRYTISTSAGDGELPAFYTDARSFFAWYLIDPERATSLISREKLELIQVGGKALVVVSFFEYLQTTLGPYNEVSVAVAVKPKRAATPRFPILSLMRPVDKNIVGFEILDLPVTTSLADVAGREIFNFPKFVTEITFSLGGKSFFGSVRDPEGSDAIVSLGGEVGPGVRWAVPDMVLYSVRDGQLLRTNVNTRGVGHNRLPGTIRLRVGDSQHPMAERLKQLGLDGLKPAWIATAQPFQSRLNQGVAIG